MKIPLAIIGSGPAGYTAAIYASRAKIDNILFQGSSVGGQLQITTDVENYSGFANTIQGPWLMEQMQKQALKNGAHLKTATIQKIKKNDSGGFWLQSDKKEDYQVEAVIIATGSQAKWLGCQNEQKFIGAGVSACATCDGFFFQNKQVVVVGGGNTAVEEALYLAKICQKVFLLHRRDSLRAEKILQARLFQNPKIEFLRQQELVQVKGGDFVESIVRKHTQTGQLQEQKISGVFIAIGHRPNSKIFENLVRLDEHGYIVTAPDSTKTTYQGIFACGDVQDKVFRQAITAAGTGCMAALEAGHYLSSR